MTSSVMKDVAVTSYLFSEFQTKKELQKTFGRGNTYITHLLRDLEEYDSQHPETYTTTNLYSDLSTSGRMYYNVFAINHFIANKMKLAAGYSVQYKEKEERERYIMLLEIQHKSFLVVQEHNALKGGA